MSAPFSDAAFDPRWSGLNHPECVVWDPDRAVLYAGGESGELYRARLDGSWEQIASVGEGGFVLGLALDGDDGLYVCERGGSRLLRLDTTSFAMIEISRGTPDRPMLCPNYPAFDDSGRLFVSDSGTWGAADGVVYSIDAEGGTRVWSDAVTDFPNGIAVSADGTGLYVAESRSSSVWRIPIGADGGAGTAERVWREAGSVPDGLAFASDGRLFISCFTPDSIYALDPSTRESSLFAHDWSGQRLQGPTNIAFAGERLDDLVTANLCGRHLNVGSGLGVAGAPLRRPKGLVWSE